MADKYYICEFCKTSCKNLKFHLSRSKKCLKIRGLTLDTHYICNGCNTMFSIRANLDTHQESCKDSRYLGSFATTYYIQLKGFCQALYISTNL